MAVITVADVLKHAEDFERMLTEYYAGLAEHSVRDGVRMLADYMARHRLRMVDMLSKLSAERVERISAIPIPYEPQAADCRCFEGLDLPPGATAQEVLDAATTLDECLVRLYRQALRQLADDEEAGALFEALIEAEQQDEIELKKIKAMDYF